MAATVVSGHVGPVFISDGIETQGLRQGSLGESIVGQAHGKYYEAVSRGNVYHAQTAATGVAPGTALGTTAAYCLHNPAGTNKRLAVMELSMGLISGTIGAGVVHILSSASGDAVPTGTAITPRNRKVGGSNSSIATPFTTATITTNAGKQIGILCSLNQEVVATTANASELIRQDVDGGIVIEAGFNINLHGTAAAGTAPLVVFGATWEEVPLS